MFFGCDCDVVEGESPVQLSPMQNICMGGGEGVRHPGPAGARSRASFRVGPPTSSREREREVTFRTRREAGEVGLIVESQPLFC